MVHIGYFSLLLFCISTNMIHSMEFDVSKEIKLESPLQSPENPLPMTDFSYLTTDDKDLWGWDSANSLKITTSKEIDLLQRQEEIYNPSKWNSINSSKTRESSILSWLDVISPEELDLLQAQEETYDPWEWYSTNSNETRNNLVRSPRKITTQEELISQTRQIPDFDTEEFSSFENMLYPFKNIDGLQQTRSPSRQQIDYSQQLSTESFETAPQQPILKRLVLMLSEIDAQSSSKTESPMSSDVEDSTVSDQEFDDQETLISEQPPRKKLKINKKNIPDDACFTIVCCFCYDKHELRSPRNQVIINNFKRHIKDEYPDKDEEETEIYIKEHLQKPRQPLQFSIRCPVTGCEYIAHVSRQSNLKRNLSNHIFKAKKHQKIRSDYPEKLLIEHISKNQKQEAVSKQHNAYFTITCTYCFDNPMFSFRTKIYLISKFNEHMKTEHQNITEEETTTLLKILKIFVFFNYSCARTYAFVQFFFTYILSTFFE